MVLVMACHGNPLLIRAAAAKTSRSRKKGLQCSYVGLAGLSNLRVASEINLCRISKHQWTTLTTFAVCAIGTSFQVGRIGASSERLPDAFGKAKTHGTPDCLVRAIPHEQQRASAVGNSFHVPSLALVLFLWFNVLSGVAPKLTRSTNMLDMKPAFEVQCQVLFGSLALSKAFQAC